ncbi:MAG: four helix bundle protein [Chloroflexi bacterium]|nr:four helix bundle protein [Chloroflexota bacterium]
MATIKRFEDVRGWQLAKELAKKVYSVTAEGRFSRDFALRDQIRGAAGSIMHNIAEGFEAGSDKEFIRFLRYSLRSAAEVQSQIYLAFELKYFEQKDFDSISSSLAEIKSNLHGFIAYLVRSSKNHAFREEASTYLVVSEDDL